MGKEYYLCKGYKTEKYQCELFKIYLDITDLDSIDTFTSSFDNMQEIKEYLNSKGLLNAEENIVIGTEVIDKFTGETRLAPIFLRDLIFAKDLKALGIEYYDPLKIANKIEGYINDRRNDKTFLTYIVSQYEEKYLYAEKPVLFFEDGSIDLLKTCLHDENYAIEHREEFEMCIDNLFFNEMYKCEITKVNQSKKYIPKRNDINIKGLHDLLIRIINYIKHYESWRYTERDEYYFDYQQHGDHEEFLEPSDFDRLIKMYMGNQKAKGNILDLYNPDIEKKDDYIKAIRLEEKTLLKK